LLDTLKELSDETTRIRQRSRVDQIVETDIWLSMEQYQRSSTSARAKTSDRWKSSQEDAEIFAMQVISQASVTPNTPPSQDHYPRRQTARQTLEKTLTTSRSQHRRPRSHKSCPKCSRALLTPTQLNHRRRWLVLIVSPRKTVWRLVLIVCVPLTLSLVSGASLIRWRIAMLSSDWRGELCWKVQDGTGSWDRAVFEWSSGAQVAHSLTHRSNTCLTYWF
jgi:hypothetical protein